jgi:hypothetical protein
MLGVWGHLGLCGYRCVAWRGKRLQMLCMSGVNQVRWGATGEAGKIGIEATQKF